MNKAISRRSALAALALIAPAASVGVYLGLAGRQGFVGIAAWMLAKVWLFGLPVLWVTCVDRAAWSFSRPLRGGFGVALLLGLVMAAAIVGAYIAIGRTAIDPALLRNTLAPLHLTSAPVYLAAAAYWIGVNSVLEEYVFRWFIFTRAERLMRSGAAVIVSAGIFVVHHAIAMAAFFPAAINALASLAIFVAALIWSWLYQRYRSIWIPWMTHACADLAIFAIGWRLIFHRA